MCIGLRGRVGLRTNPEMCSSTDSELGLLLEMGSFIVFAIDANCRYYNGWSFSSSNFFIRPFTITLTPDQWLYFRSLMRDRGSALKKDDRKPLRLSSALPRVLNLARPFERPRETRNTNLSLSVVHSLSPVLSYKCFHKLDIQ